MRNPATVSVELVRLLLQGAAAHGMDAPQTLAMAELAPALLDNPDVRVPYTTMATMFEEIPRRVGDESFGLRLAQRIDLGTLGVVGYIYRNSPDLGTVFANVVHYQKIFNEAASRELHVPDSTARIHQPKTTDPWPRHLVECAMGMIAVFARRLTGQDCSLRSVAFTHPRPADVTEHERVFRAPIEFGRPHTELVFDRAVLACPIQNADPALFSLLNRYASERLARLPQRAGLVEEARRRVCKAIPKGLPDAATIAREMGMSPRSFERHLRKEHTGYREVVASVRRELSTSYLRESQLCLTEIAVLVGFSEVSTFYRAFRRWTGMTPLDYRRRHTTW